MAIFKIKKNIKKEFEKCLKQSAVAGVSNIKSEFAKNKQKVDVTYTIKKNTITFSTSPKIDEIKSEDLSQKEVAKFKKVLGNIPLEMLSNEINKQQISDKPITKAMERTQETLSKKLNKIVEDIL